MTEVFGLNGRLNEAGRLLLHKTVDHEVHAAHRGEFGRVEPEDRSAGNYRLYGRASLDKLKFVRAAQAIGFTLEDTRALLADKTGSAPKCGAVQGLIEDRLADVEERLKDLRHVRKVLKSALVECQQQKNTDRCQVVDRLRRGR